MYVLVNIQLAPRRGQDASTRLPCAVRLATQSSREMSTGPSPEFLALQTALKGRYSIEHELGRGGMGIVYLAHEVALDRPVALKLLPPALTVHENLRERFLREARTAAKLSHPNIVPIFAVDQVDGFVFFAMAYVNGESLGQRIRNRGPLPVAEAARVLREVAWALAYAHAQGVIHRDVKPDNILLEAGSGRALVTDFGIAHLKDESGGTAVGEILGTAEFMSPEQASGEPVDARSDLYSLGVVGFHALSGNLPFQAPTVSAVLAKHITQPAPPVTTAAPETPSKLAQAVDRCLRKDPAQRFADGEALAEALGQSFEVQRQVPVALRVFVNRNRELYRVSAGGAFLVIVLVPMLLAAAEEGNPVAFVLAGLFVGGMAVVPLGLLSFRSRRLLKSGYGLDEVRLAFKQDVDRRREELTFEFGKKSKFVDRLFQGTAYSALGLAGASAVAMVAMPGLRDVAGLWITFGMSISTGTLTGLVVAYWHERRRDAWGVRWLKFWKGRFGRWMFKASGVGMKQLPTSGMATYRPTELAIGLAADRLFEDLSKTDQRSLKGLPDTVRKLEADAQQMRQRVEDLDAILVEIGDDTARAGADQRADLRTDLQTTRDLAQGRLTDAVAALETIRLGLLRMQAGAGTVESVTTELHAARDLSEDIERLLQGQDEVEQLLVRRRTDPGVRRTDGQAVRR
jgi:predicted Ser/Thr protein kinase